MDTACLCLGPTALDKAQIEAATSMLDGAEAGRLSGMASPSRRRQFLAGRSLARQALSLAVGGRPEDYALGAEAGAPPSVAVAGHPKLRLSVSHSRSMAACFLNPSGPCGVDLEDRSYVRDFGPIAEKSFSPTALALFAQGADFFELWCLREAAIKVKDAGARLALFRYGGAQGALALPAVDQNLHVFEGAVSRPFSRISLDLTWQDLPASAFVPEQSP
ncbi:MAG: 4'-phosphopantetheinyl transferase superfamily protein [candidate division FCPU426 bacterium]